MFAASLKTTTPWTYLSYGPRDGLGRHQEWRTPVSGRGRVRRFNHDRPRARVSAKPQGAQNRDSPAGLEIQSDRGLSANRSRCSYCTGDDPAGSGRANRRVVIFRVCLGRGQATAQSVGVGEIELFSGVSEKRAREWV